MRHETPIIRALLEAEDDDETIKDILGKDYYAPEPKPKKEGEIKRFHPSRKNIAAGNDYGVREGNSRWADIRIGNNHYCVSYLTPVALWASGGELIRTNREWSNATKSHITLWAAYLLITDEVMRWKLFIQRFPKTMPQEELSRQFNQEAAQVDWTPQQRRHAEMLPPNQGLRDEYQDRIKVDKYREPEED